MSAHIVTAEEAQKRLAVAAWLCEYGVWPGPQAEQILILNERVRDLAHTVVVQAEQIAAILALHQAREEGDGSRTDPWCAECDGVLPCETLRTLGVTA